VHHGEWRRIKLQSFCLLNAENWPGDVINNDIRPPGRVRINIGACQKEFLPTFWDVYEKDPG
jgi:hypothetical protein